MNKNKKKIISASRRTDIPAFYAKWFKNRLQAGFVEVVNPFNARQVKTVSLRMDDVAAFVFWTRNAKPFFPILPQLTANGYRFYFHWTLNNYPQEFEPENPGSQHVLDSMQQFTAKTTPSQLIWRYDPVILSNRTPPAWHLENFRSLAENLRHATRTCIFSFVDYYKKMEKPLAALAKQGIELFEPEMPVKNDFLQKISTIAAANGIKLMACCEDVSTAAENISAAHCIDSHLLREIYPDLQLEVKSRPTRAQCGCVESVDIGAYDSCLFGCVYCYANRNFDSSRRRFQQHDPENPRLIPAKTAHQSA